MKPITEITDRSLKARYLREWHEFDERVHRRDPLAVLIVCAYAHQETRNEIIRRGMPFPKPRKRKETV